MKTRIRTAYQESRRSRRNEQRRKRYAKRHQPAVEPQHEIDWDQAIANLRAMFDRPGRR